ncbi:3-methyl-2-oxobutanoate hydroxymethyltransferase [Jeotgalicoccus aerolatus]|uniref:3-methyl-2-oxobutanoate hydroxymethyltransferase n=1 Tax=Jeotgalicoccus aerolatus TaxID=709510 RepID=A0A1G9D6P2_9STAP|nr:3-methyl-2-oxobutanoate hydroxymethyltransferase [Jeotgalicoccus aerolatus]MBP1951564.1 3-methyl-2-oxobutanoate hydroxymethyltransferase [Jeotgalicoccus aerolatus]CAD2076109.1 3-methyl-2-oxobutanoate hydroxymethyltransferase [Jeotgalicoccus aerolatus]SDK59578.1 3-methyl-2-oxobutanoate hydroxymethyltransferase [Jeotgalicoccus aerolatus]GGD96574.1 3-methyl-2-oxobutanoate hydroxymethyltransferase [Jeotgalicoccus aerolatus]HJG32819.1 3-methyl-2-oxobutanoate hydroxymethyltransferase [Jeotgalicoc
MKSTADLVSMKNKDRIVMVTAYDYPSAKLAEEAEADIILVGDSLGMVVLGYESPVQVTLDDMIHHAKAARRGAANTFIIADMPFGSHHTGVNEGIKNGIKLYQDSNANMLKLEGADAIEVITGLVKAGVPVCGHLGLTPQHFGITGFKMQAGEKAQADQLIEDAKALEAAGASMMVLEAIPMDLAKKVTESVNIPTIGIGAGIHTDGQVLVYHDLLQYGSDRLPKFVKPYADLNSVVKEGLTNYRNEVKSRLFPAEETTYKKRVFE